MIVLEALHSQHAGPLVTSSAQHNWTHWTHLQQHQEDPDAIG
jgi:hypothetical protein